MTDRKNGAKTDGRNANGTFAAGNPGRPAGARHKTTRAVEELLDGEAEALTRKAVEMALGGDATAMRLCLERIAPARKDSPITFTIPDAAEAKDAGELAKAVLASVASGELTPAEGGAVMALVDGLRRTLEMTEIEARLTALEGAK
ncbi:DUF5681 domain-containing protein [Wenxinia saemankumensis]|uniref:DUF5681 domain-containing protein n=1 Tax=Wenxinia saemankumensis TaxID=1447782 RepID=A0A1M6HQ92_9RHOB|nr:DUF5681 domain-containing protein [Wenxinia saemankumensis]SHJ24380.1 hypothetical protein SAMN05444417_3293 [Wenxinia saemankumensis]